MAGGPSPRYMTVPGRFSRRRLCSAPSGAAISLFPNLAPHRPCAVVDHRVLMSPHDATRGGNSAASGRRTPSRNLCQVADWRRSEADHAHAGVLARRRDRRPLPVDAELDGRAPHDPRDGLDRWHRQVHRRQARGRRPRRTRPRPQRGARAGHGRAAAPARARGRDDRGVRRGPVRHGAGARAGSRDHGRAPGARRARQQRGHLRRRLHGHAQGPSDS